MRFSDLNLIAPLWRRLHASIEQGSKGGTDRPKFTLDPGFYQELKRRVQLCIRQDAAASRKIIGLYVKTGVILCWFALSYALLVFSATNWWQAIGLSISLALAIAGIGFNIQHDANHGAFAKRPAINRALGLSLDLLGASSYVWHHKHNILHHTYTNLIGWDDDIDLSPFGRLSPDQRRRPIHRVQHYYLWAIYGLLGPKWHFIDDFVTVIQGRIGRSKFRRPKGWELFGLIAGKLVFFTLAFVLPSLNHPWWLVVLFYAITWFIAGWVVSVVFQLAHCVEDTTFPQLTPSSHRLASAWGICQVKSTVNFAPRNRLLTWYLGGLNHQIEHHLFPSISHVYYPRISSEVKAVCAEYGVVYFAHESLLAAVMSHFRWLRRMGTA